MARLAFVVISIAALAAGESMTPTGLGLEMATRAYETVCWYEYLKKFPNTDTESFVDCATQAEQTQKNVVELISDEEDQVPTFGKYMKSHMSEIPSEYGARCNSALESGSSETSENEGEFVGDQGQKDYPLRAFAYCMMKTLRGTYGDSAMESVKAEKAGKSEHWMNVVAKRDNEFRARHGQAPFKLHQTLTEQAQEYADEIAKKCNAKKHSDKATRPGIGGKTGESLASSGMGGAKVELKPEDGALMASDGWYEEIKYVTFPTDGSDTRIYHFTATVWKDTQYVGYGYAYNPECPGTTRYYVARYSPVGNIIGEFEEQVAPPKD